MNLVKKIYPERARAVLDVGADTTIVLIAQKKKDAAFRVLGAGEAATHGVERGVITHLGDAVESVLQAVRKAERTAGLEVETLYFNLKDPEARSLHARGSRHLSGEGEVRRPDVEEACQMARRLVAHFEHTIVYFKELEFVIDERDHVMNPVGVFGSKLEVIAHVVQARSRICEDWNRLMERAQIERPVSVFSAWSTACGIFPKEDRAQRRFIVDAGRDLTSVFLFENGGIADYRVFVTGDKSPDEIREGVAGAIRGFSKEHGNIAPLFLVGDAARGDALENFLKNEWGVHVHRPSPLGVEKLSHPRYASLVGLLHVADELETQSPALHRKRNLLSQVKDSLVSYINEYF